MKPKPKPCTLGPRHKWVWVKNVTSYQVGSQRATFSLHGLYRCECGAKKTGHLNHNAPQGQP